MREAAQAHSNGTNALAQGANGNTVDRDGKTPLMLTASRAHGDGGILLANGVPVNAKIKWSDLADAGAARAIRTS
jgi:hypothetical protein